MDIKMLSRSLAIGVLLMITAGPALSTLVNLNDEFGWDYLEECREDPFELAIVLDSSSSIHPKDFILAKNFLQDFVNELTIGPNDIRVSMVTYGMGVYSQDGFNLDEYTNKEDLVAAIGEIPFRAGPFTATGQGIKHAHAVQLSDTQVRAGMRKVCLVITDGNSQRTKRTKQAAEAAREDDITMIALGVGKAVKDSELLNIAGDVSRVTRVDDFEKLSSIRENLKRHTCIKVLKQATPAPQTQSCGEVNPADMYFIFNPTSLGADGTTWATSFISTTVSFKDLEKGNQYGVVSGECSDIQGFRLNKYKTVGDIKNHLQKYENPMLSSLVKTVRTEGYTSKWGARGDTRKVAVIVVNAFGNDVEKGLTTEISALVKDGVKVYIIDVYQSGLEVEGATTINGSSSRLTAEELLAKLCP